MSVSKVLNLWLNRLYKTIAILLVLIAVVISAMRLMLPYAHNYRQDLQEYLSNTYQSQILIGSLSMDWQGQGPVLVAKNVSLLQSDAVNVFIKSIDIHLDFWATIRARQLITHDFTLAGAKMVLDPALLLAQQDNQAEAPEFGKLTELFLEQIERFSLRNSQIILQTQEQSSTFLISYLDWVNEDSRHQAKGDVILDGITSNNLKVQLDINGSERSEMSGQVFLAANQVNITPWLADVLATEIDNTDSVLNFNAWLTIDKGVAGQLQLVLGDNEISWQDGQVRHQLAIREGQFLATDLNNFNQFSLQSSQLKLSVDQQELQPFSVQAQKLGSNLFTYLSYVDLSGLRHFSSLLVDSEEVNRVIAQLAPTGYLTDIYLQKQSDKLQLVADFNDISTEYGSGIPGIKHASGSVSLADQQLALDIHASNGALDFQQHFTRPIPYDSLSASVSAEISDNGWQLKAEEIRLFSPELELSGDLALAAPEGGEASMSLLASVVNVDAANAHYYYPHLLMGQDLVDYLKEGIVSGVIPQASVLFNGPLQRFPFTGPADGHSGIFTVDAELEKAVFKFDPLWPAITDFSANLNFTNDSMLISARGGELTGVKVAGVEAEIKSLSDEQLLTVAAPVNRVSPKAVTELMLLSPMKDSVGATLEELVVSGPVSGEFFLSIPLQDTDATLVRGVVDFADNQIALQAPEMDFSQVNGRLTFENDVLALDKLSLNWRGLPLTLKLAAQDKSDYYHTKIDIDAGWQDKLWLGQLPRELEKYGAGELNWQGELSLNMHHDGGFSYDFTLASDMAATELMLPEPFALPATGKTPFKAKVSGQLNQSTINANFGEQLSFYGVLNHEKVQFSRAHLVLGDETMLLPMDGFHITAKLDQAKVSQWQPLILDILDSLDSNTHEGNNLLAQPERIRGSVGSLDIVGQALTDVSFNLLDQDSWWLLQLNAKEARGQIKFYPDWYAQGIDIDADFLNLKTADAAEETLGQSAANLRAENDIIFANVPPMRVHCDACRLDELDFGELDFEIKHSGDDVIELKNFVARRDKTRLTLDGRWTHNLDSSATQMSGEFSTKDVEHEIEKLGFASIIKDSGGKVEFTASWPGGPQNYALDELDGDVKVRIDDGYLADVSDKGLRILSVLSLQSLVRKLTLDFRDIFSDGIFYSEIKGDFHIEQGVLYTDNTMMKGTAGDLAMKGNTRLGEELLDYRMSYKPNLTSSLPVLAWIATLNPVTFLAGIAIDEVFTSKVVSELNFELTGSITEPDLQLVDRKTKDVSVGRSTPPKIIETPAVTPEVSGEKKAGDQGGKLPINHLQQVKEIDG
ncbi:TIGR02099 family protein [Thalassomonas viridans]|uniref:TIGR02099 family protein n=1 Tax=Thalassomonas viridans TaxID=137584 RepID=A0AAF0C8S3_9GAMM|nr:YhdP family protein [Thalassomonas viridans]WDE04485.1 TIGR02099 family protein [Thalassomonas viridans]